MFTGILSPMVKDMCDTNNSCCYTEMSYPVAMSLSFILSLDYMTH